MDEKFLFIIIILFCFFTWINSSAPEKLKQATHSPQVYSQTIILK